MNCTFPFSFEREMAAGPTMLRRILQPVARTIAEGARYPLADDGKQRRTSEFVRANEEIQ